MTCCQVKVKNAGSAQAVLGFGACGARLSFSAAFCHVQHGHASTAATFWPVFSWGSMGCDVNCDVSCNVDCDVNCYVVFPYVLSTRSTWNRSRPCLEPFWTVQNRSADTFGPATFRTNLWRKTRAKWEVGPMAHQWRPRKSRSILRHVGVTSVKLWRKNLSTWLLNRNPSANACKADLLEKSLEQQARKASRNLVAAKRLKEPLGASSEHQFTNSYTSYLQMGHRGLVWKKTLCGTPLRTSTSRNIKKCKWQSVILFYANISLIRCL